MEGIAGYRRLQRRACQAGLKSGVQDLGVSVSKIKESELVPILQTLGRMDAIDPATVAEFVANIQAGKFREQVPEYLARSLWAGQNLAPIGAITALANGLLARAGQAQ
jgi:ATP-dependent Lhr-like helicase